MTFLATNDVPGHRAEQAVPAHDEHAGLDSRASSSIRTSARSRSRGRTMRRAPATRRAAADLHLPAGDARAKKMRARARSSRRSPSARSAGRSTAADLKVLMPFYQAGRGEGGTLRRRHRGGAAAHPRRSRSSSIAASASRPALAAGRTLSPERPRAGVAPLVLPVEQHPRRRADDARRAGRLRDPAVLERQVRRMLAIRSPQALVANFTGQWLSVRVAAGPSSRSSTCSPTSTTTCATRSSARSSCSSTASSTRTAASSTC